MRFDVLTLFPALFDSYLAQSLLKKALDRGLIEVHRWNFRDWATDRHKSVDDTPYGVLGHRQHAEKALAGYDPHLEGPIIALAHHPHARPGPGHRQRGQRARRTTASRMTRPRVPGH